MDRLMNVYSFISHSITYLFIHALKVFLFILTERSSSSSSPHRDENQHHDDFKKSKNQ